jgi:hypothetical protein
MTELKYKPDFAKVMERFEAWWQCQIIDRPLTSIWAKSDKEPNWPAKKTHATVRDRWMDVEHSVACHEAAMDAALFPAECIPLYFPNVGPEVTATAFGCDLEFNDWTSYSKPVCGNIRDVLKLRPNLDNPYWNAIRKATDLSLSRGAGKWITALTDLHTNGDLLASLRDPQNLCMDLLDDPEGVRLACEHITRFYAEMYEDLYKRIAAAGQPATTWINSPHYGPFYASSCDFICMISPKQFQELILPSIAKENEYLERNIFHLDGPGALKHLDALLSDGKLTGLQWVAGAGQGPGRKWVHVLKQAQDAGKCLQILCDDMTDAKAIAEHIRPEGAWFCVGGQYSQQEVDDFIKWLDRWGAGKK